MELELRAFGDALQAGKIRAMGTSNLDAAQLGDSLAVAKAAGLHRYEVLQPEYNLYARHQFEGELRDLVTREEIGVIAYYALAAGFLTGKYRSVADFGKSPRGGGMKKYLGERGLRILAALDRVAAELSATPAEVALAWVIAAKGVTAPIASATSLSQLNSLVRATRLQLSDAHLGVLDAASR